MKRFRYLLTILSIMCAVILPLSTASKLADSSPFEYVAHFNCNHTGAYLISDSRLFADSYSKADEKCTEKNGYSLISETNATSQCGNSYIKHIEERLGKKIKIWVNSSESGPSCLPKNSSCDSNDTVILCENFDIKAANKTNCSQSLLIENGTLQFPSGYSFPSEVYATCDSGYAKNQTGVFAQCGSQPLRWLTTGQVCAAIECNISGKLPSGHFSGHAPVYWAHCNDRHQLIGNASVRCIAVNTTTPLPSCKPVCPQLSISNAQLNTSSRLDGTVVHVNCSSMFETLGPETMTCNLHNWTTQPHCEEIRCKPPPPVNNGLQVWSSRTGYGVLRLKCVPGYELVGMNTTRCLHNRSWSPPIGQCIQKACSENVLPPENGEVPPGNSTYLSVRHLQCNEGYQLHGDPYTLCLANGSWLHTNTTCSEKACSENVLPPENGKVPPGNSTYLSVRHFQCNEGYQLHGDSYTLCLTNGSWLHTNTTCSEKACSKLVRPLENGEVPPGNSTHLSVRHFQCNEGYQLHGDSYTLCLTNGSWLHTNTTCSAVITLAQGKTNSAALIAFVSLLAVLLLIALAVILMMRRSSFKCTGDLMMPLFGTCGGSKECNNSSRSQELSSQATRDNTYAVPKPERGANQDTQLTEDVTYTSVVIAGADKRPQHAPSTPAAETTTIYSDVVIRQKPS